MLSLAILALLAGAKAQKVGTYQAENHPRMQWSRCAAGRTCNNVNGEVVIDANWRWIHGLNRYDNCYSGNKWTGLCTSNAQCASNCAVEGANYQPTYGITTSGNSLRLNFVTNNDSGKNIGSRTYLMQGTDSYQMFTLANNEFAFDVDLSTVACGLNAALYFVAMDSDGGKAAYPVNTAGAKYGTGYCDAQCARDLKFIGGQGNYAGWGPSATDSQSGVGNLGSCCAEIDVWESNAHSFAFTPHACKNNKYHLCQTTGCGGTYSGDRFAGDCDANGCDYNPYRVGNPNFYGAGKTIDTNKPFTVVSSFAENNLKQFFIQGGKRFDMPTPKLSGFPAGNSITPQFCNANPKVFADRDRFAEVGGFSALTAALKIPMVLVMSIWADHYANMLWLDSIYPPEKAGTPGAARGDCPQNSGKPDQLIANNADAHVIWSNIRFGPIGSTTQFS